MERLSEKKILFVKSDDKALKFFFAFANFCRKFNVKETLRKSFLRAATDFRDSYEGFFGVMKSNSLQRTYESIRDYLEHL